ncbi:MAG: trypsin-like serine protease [Luteitalea sp.]|nr:trypsin-like serine protease [Luteitalea sp.]
MSKQLRQIGGCAGVLMAVVALATVAPVTAQGPSRSTPVSNDGSMVLSPEVGLAVEMNPFRGTGVVSAVDRALAVEGHVGGPDEMRPAASKIPSRETVLGFDSRQRVQPTTKYPQRATAYITSSIGSCTGWFAGPDLVVTAGHCVHTGGPGGSWANNVVVHPGRNDATSPYGSFAAQSLHSVIGWTNSSNEEYDYGAINLTSNIGNTVGWYGYYWQTASLDNAPAIINGYPGDKASGTQWVGADKVRATTTRQVFYKVDTFGGMSGSPMWEDRPIGSPFCANGPCAFGIHAYGTHGAAPHNANNHGTRIRQAVFNNIVNWVNLP